MNSKSARVSQLRFLLACGLLGAGLAVTACAQNLLPNSGFEAGTDSPSGWRLSDSQRGQWSATAHQGQRAVMVEGTGQESSSWRTERLPLKPGGLYRLSFVARNEAGTSGGCGVSGLSRVNHDFRASDSWQRQSFILSVPDDGTNDYVRLGQWEVKGKMLFDDAELLPVSASHARWGDLELGEGESVSRGVYRFRANCGWRGANLHRTLFLNRANFNSDRWCFGAGSEVVYRLNAGTNEQRSAKLQLQINYHTGGRLRVEASRAPRDWTPVATFDGTNRAGTVELPAALFPAKDIFVRLSGVGEKCNLQVNTFNYEAPLAEKVADLEGRTAFFEQSANTGELGIALNDTLQPPAERSAYCIGFWVTNRATSTLNLNVDITIQGRKKTNSPPLKLGAGEARFFGTRCSFTAPGRQELALAVSDSTGRTLYAGRTDIEIDTLAEPRAGYFVGGDDLHNLWWCESGWKLGQNKQWPSSALKKAEPVRVSAARGEFEPVQLVLRAFDSNTLLAVRFSPFTNAAGAAGAITARVDRIEYVHVTQPTDSSCARGRYPDPLSPLQLPLRFQQWANLPLWITFHVSRGMPAGDYTGQVELELMDSKLSVPLALHVYDFELPRETHLKSALGLGTGEINRYHKLKTPEDKQAVYEKYLKNFAEHRISPYSFFDYAPIDIKFTGQGTNKQAKVDFTKFDAAAARWLDEYKFNSYSLPLRGMGGGTFHSRHLGSLEGFKEGTPEFARLFQDYLSQVTGHLRERGWLDEAYTYWFDEPDPKDYEFVVDGMKRIRAAAPGLRRMLTEQPEAALMGHVEIWCGLTPEWTKEKVAARRAAGEEVWWYICCGPHAPYITEFIDHPGTELRLWPWQSWQYGVQGILIWATTYWTSSAAFPGKLQDPWADPMSYVSGYDFKAGHVGYWGNGDGRFLYPPRRDPNTATEPCLDEPINSIRWENLRDGMEDYEYFWLLEQEVKRVEGLKGEELKGEIAEARRLLVVPEEISKDLTHFTTDPRLMLAHRDKVAKMIERLKRQ
ncbi:MAG: DUF4091 domain-containing protein [Verrucomicrobia bacterium]|nr:DUF4091 domain-containing protein [Verrucomicrobiota bacterium]